jgi:hypothetical protein
LRKTGFRFQPAHALTWTAAFICNGCDAADE